MTEADLEVQILRHVARTTYQPVKPRILAKQLGLPPEQMVALRRAVKRLVSVGKLRFGPKHVLSLAEQTNADERLGRFRRTSQGYGFVRPSEGSAKSTPDEDIYIPANKTKDAADGDLVLVRLGWKRRGKTLRTSGEILRVVKRQTHQFVGTYVEEAGEPYVMIDGTSFGELVPVPDARATRVRPQDRVVIEMVKFPSLHSEGEAIITEILGDRRQPGVDTLTVIREFGLLEEFSADTIDEARQVAAQFDDTLDAERRDLTSWSTVTIDPEDARDFDDAISLKQQEDGSWLLLVHIADVAHFVREGSLLDLTARERGTSVYLPDRVIPMLPEIVSNHLASLQPERLRLTRTAAIVFGPDGERRGVKVYPSAIRSDRRFSYEEVDAFLADREGWRSRLRPDIWQLLDDMHTLAMMLRRRRMSNGSLEINMPKVKVVLDENGRVTAARPELQTESHQIIEEFMLAANMSVAEILRDAKVPFLRRVHDEPRASKIEALDTFVRQLHLAPANLRERAGLRRLLSDVAGTVLEPVVNLAVLKSMAKAVYSPEPLGHYALASDCYCHFTSPIRRYPDLTVHRALDALDHQERRRKTISRAALAQLGDECSELEQRAERAEREVVKLKLLAYFGERLGERFAAVVTGLESYGLFVQCVEVPGEGLILRERLRHDFRLDRSRTRLVSHHQGVTFQVGDLVEVEVSRVDYHRREIDFEYLRHLRPLMGPHQKQKRVENHKATGRRKAKLRGQKRPGKAKRKK